MPRTHYLAMRLPLRVALQFAASLLRRSKKLHHHSSPGFNAVEWRWRQARLDGTERTQCDIEFVCEQATVKYLYCTDCNENDKMEGDHASVTTVSWKHHGSISYICIEPLRGSMMIERSILSHTFQSVPNILQLYSFLEITIQQDW
jgi:hypothetical protein